MNVWRAPPAQVDPDCEVVVAEATPDDPKGEIRLVDIRQHGDFGELGSPDVAVKASRIRGLSSATRENAAEALLLHLLGPGGAGIPGNQHADRWHAANFTYRVFDPSATGPSHFYCSSLVWWAYTQAGVDLRDHSFDGPVDHAYVTPDDLVTWNTGADDITGDVGVDGGSVEMHSPAHVMLVDPLGRRAGKDGAGTLFQEIPGAIWRDAGDVESVSAAGLDESWDIVMSGYATGPYTVALRLLGQEWPQSPHFFAGDTHPGKVERHSILRGLVRADEPLAADDAISTRAGRAVDIDVLANDRDFGNDLWPSTLAVVAPPARGTATVAGGRVRYVPAAGHTGADSFRYRICDENEQCDEATVTVTTVPAVAGQPGGGPGGSGGPGGRPGGPRR